MTNTRIRGPEASPATSERMYFTPSWSRVWRSWRRRCRPRSDRYAAVSEAIGTRLYPRRKRRPRTDRYSTVSAPMMSSEKRFGKRPYRKRSVLDCIRAESAVQEAIGTQPYPRRWCCPRSVWYSAVSYRKRSVLDCIRAESAVREAIGTRPYPRRWCRAFRRVWGCTIYSSLQKIVSSFEKQLCTIRAAGPQYNVLCTTWRFPVQCGDSGSDGGRRLAGGRLC